MTEKIESLQRYLIQTSVQHAEGTQTWWVDAESGEAALAAYKAGEGDIYSSEVEVTGLGEPELGGTTALDDYGDVKPEQPQQPQQPQLTETKLRGIVDALEEIAKMHGTWNNGMYCSYLARKALSDARELVEREKADSTFARLGRTMYAMTPTVHTRDLSLEEACGLVPALWQRHYDASPQQAQPTDWTNVAALIDAANSASARGFLSGTSNWAAFVSRAMAQQAQPQAGMVLVPVEPTDAMQYAGAKAIGGMPSNLEEAVASYSAMIAAAPAQQEQK